MTADDFLRSVHDAKIEARRCETRLAELRAQCERLTAAYGDGTPGGGGGDKHRDAVLAAAADQAGELVRAVGLYHRYVDLAEKFIMTLPDVRHRMVLRIRYIDGARWGDVQTALRVYGMSYELRQIFRLHGAALSEARRRFDAWAEKHPEIQANEEDGRA